MSVRIDPSGKQAGRGAYVHDRRSCWERALRQHALERALKTTINEQDLQLLWERAQAAPDDPEPEEMTEEASSASPQGG